MSVETRTLPCADGAVITYDLHRPDGEGPWPLVLLCHGFKGFRRWGLFPHLAARLAEGGRLVANLDLSHNGTSGGEDFDRLDLFERQTPGRHVADLLALLEALAGEPDRERSAGVSLVGHSLGGGVALLAAARDQRVDHVATLNGVSHFDRLPAEAVAAMERDGRCLIPNARTGQDMPLGRGYLDQARAIDLVAACDDVSVPVLLLCGEEDMVVPPGEGADLHSWLPVSRQLLVPGGDHTLGARHPWQGWTPALEEALAALDEFLPRRGART